MKQRQPNPIADFLVMVALVAVFYMAIEALVYQYAIAENLPPNATFTMPDLSDGAQTSPSPVRSYR